MLSNPSINLKVDAICSLKFQPQALHAEIKATFVENQSSPEFLALVTDGVYRCGEFTIAGHMANLLCQLFPTYSPAYGLLSNILMLFGRAQDASALCQKALALNPQDKLALYKKNALYMFYFGDPSRPAVRAAQQAVGQQCFPKPECFLNEAAIDKNPDRKIRLGYVSTDLRQQHPVYRFMDGILKHHDSARFEVFVYNLYKDFSEESLLADDLNSITVRDISDFSLQRSAKQIRSDKIDVLVDLNGHSGDTTGELFHHRVAPVQLTYLGYPGTSGLANMDFRIGDEYADPPQFDAQNTEKVLRMKTALWHYRPWSDMPDVRVESAFKRKGYITFGSANNHAKLQNEWLVAWAEILAKVPNSRLFIKSRVLENQDVVKGIKSIFAQYGVEESRLDLKHFSRDRAQHWEDLQNIDIALDAYPYNGTTTTCDLLWLGVPVLTRAGNAHVARTTGSILNALGLNEWVSESKESFVRAAVSKAQDLEGLERLHRELNARFKASSLGDINLFMPQYENTLSTAWANYCEAKSLSESLHKQSSDAPNSKVKERL